MVIVITAIKCRLSAKEKLFSARAALLSVAVSG
jgi:hypothetical protein